MRTLSDLRSAVQRRLGDPQGTLWPVEELDGYFVTGYRDLARIPIVFWDWVYLENLPPSFSYTFPDELDYIDFDAGMANHTFEDERQYYTDEEDAVGPAMYTCPAEATGGYIDAPQVGTAEMPRQVIDVDRGSWDTRGIAALSPYDLAMKDTRYQITQGEVFGYTWRQDGVRTIRKVRVPAGQATCAEIDGSWGAMRDPSDLSGDTITGTWGVPRRIPSHFAMGYYAFGLPRRPYLDGMNTRFEVQRQGSPLEGAHDECELPDRYANYLLDYVQSICYGRKGAGQDLKLAKYYDVRWQRNIARLKRRTQTVYQQRTGVLGGSRPLGHRPPTPSFPWTYGRTVRYP